jgi:D-sedoheptulose 7-phosphate isomerase
VGRFERERRALPAIALPTNTSTLTGIGNDYSYDSVFVRQLEGLSSPGDVAVGISTSGKSLNVVTAVRGARKTEVITVGMTGIRDTELASSVDLHPNTLGADAAYPGSSYSNGHILCEVVEWELINEGYIS